MLSQKELAAKIKPQTFGAMPKPFVVTDSCREIYQDGNRIVMMAQSMADVMCIERCAKACKNLKGDVAEAGVCYGSTARLIMRWFEGTNKTIHLFDTFDVMPDADSVHDWPEMWHPQKDLSVDKVTNLLEDYCEQGLVKIHKGLFSDTFPTIRGMRFCFVHVDCDLYEGAKDACEFFYPKMVKGGIMMFHDYDVPAFPGIQRAVEEYFIYKPDLRITNRYGGHHIVIKK